MVSGVTPSLDLHSVRTLFLYFFLHKGYHFLLLQIGLLHVARGKKASDCRLISLKPCNPREERSFLFISFRQEKACEAWVIEPVSSMIVAKKIRCCDELTSSSLVGYYQT